MLSPHQLHSSWSAWQTEMGPGNRREKKVAHNTWAIRYPDGAVGIKYHSTVIATFFPSNHEVYPCGVEFHAGGWMTPTTKTRLNAMLPGRVGLCQHNHRWYYWRRNPETMLTEECPYEDNAVIYPDGEVWYMNRIIL